MTAQIVQPEDHILRPDLDLTHADFAMTGVERWIEHGPMPDPGDFGSILTRLPSDVGAINRTIQGLLIHSDWLTEFGVDEKSFGAVSRQTLPVAKRLAAIQGKDARPLDIPRLPDQRAVGTCRDFALLLCSILRSKEIPARVRCGFAPYFHDDWEDDREQARAHQFANDAIPVTNHSIEMTGSSPAMTGLAARAVS